MKNYLIILFSIFMSFQIEGQITELNFGVNVKLRYDKMNVLIPNPYTYKTYEVTDGIWVTSLGLTYRDKYSMMLEYSNEEHRVGYGVKQPQDKVNLWGNIVDICRSFNLSLGYKLFSAKSKLNIIPQVGFAYAISSEYNSQGQNSSGITNILYSELGITFKSMKITEPLVDKGFNKGYFFLRPRIEFTYTPFYYFTLFINGGYNFGFKPIGYLRGWYQLNEEPQVDFKVSNSGNYFYYGLGARLNFKLNQQKTSPSRKKH